MFVIAERDKPNEEIVLRFDTEGAKRFEGELFEVLAALGEVRSKGTMLGMVYYQLSKT